MAKKKTNKPKYIYAFDKTIGKRVIHIIKDGYAISLVSGAKFKYKKGGKR